MPTLTKLDLKTAIILEDARRIRTDQKPINNIRQLAIEVCSIYPDYDEEVLYKTLWRCNRRGYSGHGNSKDMNEIIDCISEILHVDRDDLMIIIRQ